MERIPAVKILVISHEYPPIGGGGGRVVQDLCKGLASREYDFYILTAHHAGLPDLETQEHLTIERLHSCRRQEYRASLFSMFCFVWKSFWRALRIIKIWKPDLIHAHFAVPAGASAAMAALLTRTPYILTIHGGDVPGGAPEKTGRWFKFIKPFTAFIWKKARKIIAVSDFSRQLALMHYPVQIEVIPNGIDRKRFSQDVQPVHSPPQLLFVGRFSPEKNAIALPDILNEIADLPWSCTMIGDGPHYEKVNSHLLHYHLDGRVRLTGWISQEDVNIALSQSDLLLMPSLRESMPLVGLQALAAGVGLLVSDVGACAEMVDEGQNGFLLPANDISGFTRTLRSLLSTTEIITEFKKVSKKKSAAFDLHAILDQYRSIYQEISGI